MKKYYFYSSMYQYYQSGNWKPQSGVTEMHPLQWVKHLNDTVNNSDTVLTGWQEITEEEYNMYNGKDGEDEFLTKQS
jgi:hypothetical protein